MAARKRVALRHDDDKGDAGAKETVKKQRRTPVKEPDDRGNITLLMVLYTLQGLPMGLSGAIPLLLAGKVAYKDQAVLAMASLPFSLKLLWAPLVDAAYVPWIGRRKTWVVPCQLLIGALMIGARGSLEQWMSDEPNARALAFFFFVLYCLCATQDIAVDGWALTMLSEKNVGWASTCNSAGQSLGFALSYIGFVALHDEATCNKYLRAEPGVGGLVSVASFMQGVGWVFVATTVVVAFVKSEPTETTSYSAFNELKKSYARCARTLALRPVQLLCCVLVTGKFAFSALDSCVSLRCVELGMPKDDIALLSPLLLLISILLPVSMARLTAGPAPMNFYLAAVPLRLLLNPCAAVVLAVVKGAYSVEQTNSPRLAFMLYALLTVTRECASNLMFVSQMAFFARVVDPDYGGTDLTLLNTVSNLGGMWPPTIALYGLDLLPRFTTVDALTLELGLCTLVGLGFLALATPVLARLQKTPLDHWRPFMSPKGLSKA